MDHDAPPCPPNGDADTQRMFREIYAELHGIARQRMAAQPPGHTLQATALVSEAFLKLQNKGAKIRDREHFLRLAARAMRSILVDHSRRRTAGKRPPPERRVDAVLESVASDFEARSLGLESLDAALAKLELLDSELAELVELHFFGGQSMDECAKLLGISQRQAFRRWKSVRAFLHREVTEALGDQES